MRDLLYLKDEQIKDFIQLLFYAYRETFSDPKEVLSKVCKILNVDWDEGMLKWSQGIEDYDGIWASHWYSSVKNSTCFKPEKDKNIILTDNEKRIVDMAMPIYEELYSKAI